MAYVLEAFIGRPPVLARLVGESREVAIVDLGQSLSLLPFTDGARRVLLSTAADLASPNPPFSCLSRAAALSAQQRSGADGLAYVEAEFFGGRGEQSAIVWRGGYLELGPVTAVDAINRALRALGVQSGEAQDEFDTLGLGRHRATERWAP